MSLPETFWAKTQRTDCIVWTGAQNTKGYGCFTVNGSSQLAHRVAWADTHGPIPAEMTVDHLCRNRACVNTDHMELVTAAENTRRRFRVVGGLRPGTTCRHGHDINDESDLYARPQGTTDCRECRREAKREARRRAS